MRLLALVNAGSGTVSRIGPEAIGELIRRFADDAGAELTLRAGPAAELIDAARAGSDAFDAIICAGGDGTQAAVAGQLVGARAALMPLPCGTMNLLCRDLGIPLDIESALKSMADAPKSQIDIGFADDRAFLNNLVFGTYGELAEAREELRSVESIEDIQFAIVSAAHALFNAEPIRFDVDLDGERVKVHSNTLVISLNRITGAENFVPFRASLSGGSLVAYMTNAADGVDLTRTLIRFAQGAAEGSPQIEARECDRCRVAARDDKFTYTIDGDPLEFDQPLQITIRRNALTVFYPRLSTSAAHAAAACVDPAEQ